MYTKLSIPERLKDLRVSDRHLTLEQLAEQTGLSKSALSKYESDDYKDISPFAIATLANFYGVSTDYLMGLSENKRHQNTELQSLHLNDEMVDILKNGNINTRLLCEFVTHKDFPRLLIDMEIFIDRIADMRTEAMDTLLEATRQEIASRYSPGDNDLYMRTLEVAQVQEEDYFCHTIHNDIDRIIKDIRDTHADDQTTADPQPGIEEIRQQLNRMLGRYNGEEAMIRVFCEQMDIPYDKLTSEEFTVFMRIISKSRLVSNPYNMRGKGGKKRKK